MKPIVNIADVELQPRPTAYAPPASMNDRYGGVRMGMMSARATTVNAAPQPRPSSAR